MTPAKKQTRTDSINIRVTPELYNKIYERAAKEGEKPSTWARCALEELLDKDGFEPDLPVRDEIANLLLYDEGIADMIYEKVAEKMRLNDILRELASFATHYKGESEDSLTDAIRNLFARIFFLVGDSFDEDEIIAEREAAGVDINWDAEWELADFYALPRAEREKHDVFYMECYDPDVPLRSEGIYFFAASERAEKLYPVKFFNPGEHVRVHGAKLFCNLSEKAVPDLASRVVKMVRYVSRDYNLGDTGTMNDGELREYVVRNVGYYPRGIPYEFDFGWVSDALNTGQMTEDEFRENWRGGVGNIQVRPSVQCTWHYTRADLRRRMPAVVPPFLEMAVPKYISLGGQYEDAKDRSRKGRFIKPVWTEDDDPERADYEEHKEAVRMINRKQNNSRTPKENNHAQNPGNEKTH